LSRRIPADEGLLRALRSAALVEVFHPSDMPPEAARAAWNEYLAGVKGRHVVGLAANAAVSPVSVVLAPLPGPNILGYWFVYRAACHALALLGLRRASGDRVPTVFEAQPALDPPIGPADAVGLAGSLGLDAERLEDFIERQRGAKGAGRHEPTAAT